MRYISYTIVAVCVNLILQAQPIRSENDLGQAMVKAFQQKSFNLYKEILISNKDFISEVSPAIRADSLHHVPEFMMQDALNFYKSGKIEILNEYLFNEIWNKGTSLGILNWSEVSYVKFTSPRANVKNESNVINGNVHLVYDKKLYIIYGVTAYKLQSGLRLIFARGIAKDEPNDFFKMLYN